MSEPVIDLLDSAWSSLVALARDLDESEWDTPTELPGWTVRDVVAHVIGTERMLLGEEAPSPPAGFGEHVRNAIGELNEAWVDARRGLSGAELAAELAEVTRRRLDELRSLDPEAWDAIGFTPEGDGPYRRFMQIRVFDCWEHEQDIRRATGRPGHLDGPVAGAAIQEVVGKLGYIVGKRAAVADGTTVVFDIVGSIPMILPVFVDGRARILDRDPASPDVTIRLDTETFNALGCGRWPADQVLESGRVELDGDLELGRRVLENMAFVI